ncbi:hypothetical protein B0H14DRAFT_2585204 [Mycena olivaceomarginata]|nr:hypothetical protein B0H14DRAFT_2585204 [Mycena olivaceomarginata]
MNLKVMLIPSLCSLLEAAPAPDIESTKHPALVLYRKGNKNILSIMVTSNSAQEAILAHCLTPEAKTNMRPEKRKGEKESRVTENEDTDHAGHHGARNPEIHFKHVLAKVWKGLEDGYQQKSWLNKPILKGMPANSLSQNVEDFLQMGRSMEIEGLRKDRTSAGPQQEDPP